MKRIWTDFSILMHDQILSISNEASAWIIEIDSQLLGSKIVRQNFLLFNDVSLYLFFILILSQVNRESHEL